MNAARNPGRVAGLFYLLLVVIAPYRLIYIPRTLFVSGDAAATADNIAAHELMFRLGIVADLASGVTLKSGFLPRFLGVWLIINGVAYLIISFTGLLLPEYANKVFNLAFPALLGEMAFMLWLVIKGARPQQTHAAAASSAT